MTRPISFRTLALALALSALPWAGAGAQGGDVSGDATVEFRIFPRSPLFTEQDPAHVSPSFRLTPEVIYEWNDGLDRFTFTPFVRADWHDGRRTHVDIRELNWMHQAENWSLLAGFGKVFWGVTESRHLVDIVNQTDLVENPDGEEKLGQLMVNLTLERNWGALDLYFLPYFRERTFPEDDARLRGPYPILGTPTYESGLEEWHPDWAVRWSRTWGEFDVGIAHFRGTSREARFLPEIQPDGTALRPQYDIVDQTSLDLQRTHDAWLWKLELIGRRGHGDYFAAATGGVEYTFYQVFESAADVGIVAEYLYDGRDPDPSVAPFTSFNHDLFSGVRFGFNNISDTQVLAGTVVDTENGETYFVLEASHRVGGNWRIEFESNWFLHSEPGGFAATFRRDSSLTARLSRFF